MKNSEAIQLLNDIKKSPYILTDEELGMAETIEVILPSGVPLPDPEALFLLHLHEKASVL